MNTKPLTLSEPNAAHLLPAKRAHLLPDKRRPFPLAKYPPNPTNPPAQTPPQTGPQTGPQTPPETGPKPRPKTPPQTPPQTAVASTHDPHPTPVPVPHARTLISQPMKKTEQIFFNVFKYQSSIQQPNKTQQSHTQPPDQRLTITRPERISSPDQLVMIDQSSSQSN